ncbi:short-chain dehydrogenase/reductase SDR [Cylindrospermum sp. NIES-4074]|nr:short-chain dehydrogenase/reductase SDR [Cylindrospermum sp. NIES-4074]
MVSKKSFTGSVVISGASSGIGEACAIYLDKLGYQVFAGVRSDADGEALKCKTSERLTPIFLDVTNEVSIIAAANRIKATLDSTGLTGLVNNAGIVIAGPLEFLPVADLREQFEINVIGQIAVTQAFLPLLRESQGRIINMSSDNGKVSIPFLGSYCASKFALEALTDALRIELQPWGIAVCIIEPGSVTTPIWKKSISKADNIWNNLPPEARSLYSVFVDSAHKKANELSNNGFPAEVVAKAVAHALTTKRPKIRYVVGLDAKINIWLAKILPDWILDKLIAHYLGIAKNS